MDPLYRRKFCGGHIILVSKENTNKYSGILKIDTETDTKSI